jgi:hypothetical protein
VTKLPVESWNIKPRLDLPRYDLNEFCPITGEVPEPGSHHIVRKSFTALGKDDNARLFWVELEDGEVIGNRIRLSSQAHFRITTNRAAIVFANGVYYWEEANERVPLRWQPPTLHRRKTELIELDPAVTFPADPEAQELGGYSEAPSEGEECKLCRRRVPHKKKASSPSETKPMTFGRAPADAADELKQRIDDLAKSSGLSEQAYPQVRAIMLALLLAENVDSETLAEVASGMTWGRKDG